MAAPQIGASNMSAAQVVRTSKSYAMSFCAFLIFSIGLSYNISITDIRSVMRSGTMTFLQSFADSCYEN